MPTVVATVGTIPGAGATSVVAGLGAALGEQRRQVALVDASPQGSRIADVLELEGGGELADALRRNASLPVVQAEGPHGVAAFPAAPDTSWGSIRPDAVATVYEQLRDRFEFVLVDCGSELTPASIAWLAHADETLIVTDPDVTDAVEDVATLAAAFDVPIRGVVGNRVPPTETRDALRVMAALDQPVVAVFPEDPTVDAAGQSRESVLLHEPDSPIASTVWRFALRFREVDHDELVVAQGNVPLRRDDSTADDPGAAAGESSEDVATAGGDSSTGGDAGTAGGDRESTARAAAASTGAASTDSTGADSSDSTGVGSTDSAGSGSSRTGTAAGTGPSTTGDSDAGGSGIGPSRGSAPSSRRGSSASETGTSSGSADSSTSSAGASGDGTDSSNSGPGSAGRDRTRRTSTSLGPSRDDARADGARPAGTGSDRDAASLFGDRDGAGPSDSGDRDADADAGVGAGAPTGDDRGDGGSGSRESREEDLDIDVDASGDDGWTAGEQAANRSARDEPSPAPPRRSGGDSGADSGDDSDVLSDEEIEEVFKETMERVKRQREAEEREGS